MSVSASLDDSPVSVQPGGEADLPVQVLNSGTTVEEFRFEVVGPCAAWVTVEPAALSLYPGASGTATLSLRPPRSPRISAGPMPLGLRVIPTNDTEHTQVPERTITILPFAEVTAELVPRSSHSPWRGRHKLAVDNLGNTPLTLDLATQEGTERAKVTFEPAELTIPPGQAKFAQIAVRPTNRLWRGAPITHPFQVVATARGAEGVDAAAPHAPVVVDGSYEQQAILPHWLPRALIVAVLLVGVLAGLWYSLLRPTVRSAAREAITPEAIESAIDENKNGEQGDRPPGQGGDTAGATGGGANGGEATGGGANGGSTAGNTGGAGQNGGRNGGGSQGNTAGNGNGGGSGKPGEPGGPAAPKSARVQVRDAVGGSSTTRDAYTVPEGKTFALTDIVVQNPQGDAGTLTVSSQDGQILNLALENFRDSDYHFVTPIQVPAKSRISISVSCREVGKPVKAPRPTQCSESLFLGGSLVADAPAED
ncbi:hypothetical protein OYE22_29645 [Streptomyces sp. 71268]|uniref:COG1470 family protein n=1 Tax=Streptomyces sp. 71268 TaxID=3002640 RepID=UPI0023F9C079|nr:hypothetical protein [Streptomyces sp. 71268]WEV28885.1 hypothetical protein OYE22_29645 [Streptomyces sp. 71268]